MYHPRDWRHSIPRQYYLAIANEVSVEEDGPTNTTLYV